MWKLVHIQTEVLCPVALRTTVPQLAENLVTAADNIHEHYISQIMNPPPGPPIFARIAPPETPLERDRLIWEFNSDHELRMDRLTWTPHNSRYPGPRYDINNNLIERHSGYTPSTSPRHMEIGPSDQSDGQDEAAADDSDLSRDGGNTWEVHC